jgi:hypothetical protein
MGGTAQEFYEKGITLSMQEPRIGADDAGITAYINSQNTRSAVTYPNNSSWNIAANSNVPVAYLTNGSKEQQLEQIGTQKWIAIYPDGWEAWAELRRTNYPTPYPRLNSDNEFVPADMVMPRLIFVQGEYDNNSEAVLAAEEFSELTSKGGNLNSTKLWWDAKPDTNSPG